MGAACRMRGFPGAPGHSFLKGMRGRGRVCRGRGVPVRRGRHLLPGGAYTTSTPSPPGTPPWPASYFDGDAYIQHNTAIADGVSGLNAALAALAALAEQGIQMIYDETHMVLAQGNFVLAVSEGTYGGAPTSYYDLWRVEDGKIAEHWDVMETIADESTWQNPNGKF